MVGIFDHSEICNIDKRETTNLEISSTALGKFRMENLKVTLKSNLQQNILFYQYCISCYLF